MRTTKNVIHRQKSQNLWIAAVSTAKEMKGGNGANIGSEVTLLLEPRSGSIFLAVDETHGKRNNQILEHRQTLFFSCSLTRGREKKILKRLSKRKNTSCRSRSEGDFPLRHIVILASRRFVRRSGETVIPFASRTPLPPSIKRRQAAAFRGLTHPGSPMRGFGLDALANFFVWIIDLLRAGNPSHRSGYRDR